jgi:hypothetical protein
MPYRAQHKQAPPSHSKFPSTISLMLLPQRNWAHMALPHVVTFPTLISPTATTPNCANSDSTERRWNNSLSENHSSTPPPADSSVHLRYTFSVTLSFKTPSSLTWYYLQFHFVSPITTQSELKLLNKRMQDHSIMSRFSTVLYALLSIMTCSANLHDEQSWKVLNHLT